MISNSPIKYLISEKQNSIVIYVDANTITEMSRIADLIDDNIPDTVVEVTHNRNAKQGSIILIKDTDINMINKLLS